MVTKYKRQTGQVVVILLLIIVVALAIGLSVVGRSITEISTSSKTEDSSKAFSAAEAGIEKALQSSGSGGNLGGALSNQADANYETKDALPPSQTAIEYPPYGKEAYALFWLANPNVSPPSAYYNQASFDIYFGMPDITIDPTYEGTYDYTQVSKPAIEVQVVTYDTFLGYLDSKYMYDSDSARQAINNFGACTVLSSIGVLTTNYTGHNGRRFYCRATVSGYSTSYPVLVRVRLLYSDKPHPVALKPSGTCGANCSLPYQLKIYTSTGTAGNSQRKIQVFQIKKAVPDLFGYALFSAGDLNK